MIEHIETNQIVLFMPGIYDALIKNALIPNIYLSRLVVVCFGSLKKQINEFQIDWTRLQVP